MCWSKYVFVGMLVLLVLTLYTMQSEGEKAIQQLYRRYPYFIKDHNPITNNITLLLDANNEENNKQFNDLFRAALFRLSLIKQNKQFIFPAHFADKEIDRLNSMYSKVQKNKKIGIHEIVQCAIFANPIVDFPVRAEPVLLNFQYGNQSQQVALKGEMAQMLSEIDTVHESLNKHKNYLISKK